MTCPMITRNTPLSFITSLHKTHAYIHHIYIYIHIYIHTVIHTCTYTLYTYPFSYPSLYEGRGRVDAADLVSIWFCLKPSLCVTNKAVQSLNQQVWALSTEYGQSAVSISGDNSHHTHSHHRLPSLGVVVVVGSWWAPQ